MIYKRGEEGPDSCLQISCERPALGDVRCLCCVKKGASQSHDVVMEA